MLSDGRGALVHGVDDALAEEASPPSVEWAGARARFLTAAEAAPVKALELDPVDTKRAREGLRLGRAPPAPAEGGGRPAPETQSFQALVPCDRPYGRLLGFPDGFRLGVASDCAQSVSAGAASEDAAG